MKSTQETAPKSLKVSFSEALKKKKKKPKVLHFQMGTAYLFHTPLSVQPTPPWPITEALLMTLRFSELVSKRSCNAYTLR